MIRIGVVGTGGISKFHMDVLSQMEDVEIIAVCDIDEKRAIETKEKYGAKGCETDFRNLMQIKEIDGILCCVPTFAHPPIVIEAANAGKHIFCEKPLCMSLEDAGDISRAVEKSKVKFQVGFVRRFEDQWLKFGELIRNGTIGRPILWRGVMAGSAPGNLWFLDTEKGGGPFIDGCVHNYDFARSIFGEAKETVASLFKFSADTTALDTGTALVRFKSGDDIMLSWSWGLPVGSSGGRIHDAIGPKGSIILQGEQIAINLGEEKKETVKIEPGSIKRAFARQMEHFVTCIKEDKTPSVGLEAGIESLKVGLAVLESARAGKKVSIDSVA